MTGIHTTKMPFTQLRGNNDTQAHHTYLKKEAFSRFKKCARMKKILNNNSSNLLKLPGMIVIGILCLEKHININSHEDGNLMKNAEKEEIEIVGIRTVLGTSFNIRNIPAAFEDSIPYTLLLITSRSTEGNEEEKRIVGSNAERSKNKNEGSNNYSSIDCRNSSQIWQKGETHTFQYRVSEIENFVIGAVERISKREMEALQDPNSYKQDEWPVTTTQQGKVEDKEGSKAEMKSRRFEEYMVHILSDMSTYVTFRDKQKPEWMRTPNFSQHIQEFHENWVSNERKKGKKYMDFMKNGVVSSRVRPRRKRKVLVANPEEGKDRRKEVLNSTKRKTQNESKHYPTKTDREEKKKTKSAVNNSKQDGNEGKKGVSIPRDLIKKRKLTIANPEIGVDPKKEITTFKKYFRE